MTDRRMMFARALGFVTVLTLLCLAMPIVRVAADNPWYGEYFGNSVLAGNPVLTRYDSSLNFDWGLGSPGSGVPKDGFSARWVRTEWFDGGTYRFSHSSDDGVRVWVGTTLVVDDWRERQAGLSYVDHHIPAGSHKVRVQYFESTGAALLQVRWEPASQGAAWRGEYYDNMDLAGAPVLVRTDTAIAFDWGKGSPNSVVPKNKFSVRWTSTLYLDAGTYEFNAGCDDGVRIFVDGSRIVDAWYDQELPNTRTGITTLTAGRHTVVVEYCEHQDLASAHVWWSPRSSLAGWEGRYYDNLDLTGDPVLVRDDPNINFNWGSGAPAKGMPSDNFSAQWTRHANYASGYYELNVNVSGGVRVYVAGQRVMDYWEPQQNASYSRDGVFLRGTQELQVEYTKGTGNGRIHFWIERSGRPLPPPPGNPPVACVSGPLELDAWPISVVPAAEGYEAYISVNARGGDCRYTYRWEGRVVGGPTHESLSIMLFSPTKTAMVGRISVTSRGQTVSQELYVRPPED